MDSSSPALKESYVKVLLNNLTAPSRLPLKEDLELLQGRSTWSLPTSYRL